MTSDYDPSTSPRLDMRAHVRMRPGMYFGGTDSRGMHQLLWDMIDNLAKQVLKGHIDTIIVTLHDAHTITIEDNGEGIPTAIYEDTGKTLLEMFLTGNGGYLGKDGKFLTSMFGPRLANFSAVSSKMDVVVKRDGFVWEATYQAGLPTNGVRITRPMQDGESTGTKITFSPDFDIFEKNDFQPTIIMERLKELSFLLPKTTFIFIDPHGTQTAFLSQNGLVDYIHTLNKAKNTLHPPIGISLNLPSEFSSVYETYRIPLRLDVAFQYVDDKDSFILSYATTQETHFGGTHVDEFIDLLNRWVNREIKDDNFKHSLRGLSPYDITSGLVAVIHIVHPIPQFESQIKIRYVEKLEDMMGEAIWDALKKYGESHPDVIQTIVAKCLANYHYHHARKTGE